MNLRNFSRNPVFIVLSLILTACSFPLRDENISLVDASSCKEQILTKLYFGLEKPGGEVAPDEWNNFIASTISPKFPAGLTILDASGQWLNANKGLTKERSKIVEIVHAGSQQEREGIRQIVSQYKSRYQQEAVMEIQQEVRACF